MPKYPLFRNPEKYLETRESGQWKNHFKQTLENRAIKTCLEGVPLENGVLDVPCGPGRLFSLWARLGIPFYGVELSSDFIEYAKELHQKLNGKGWVATGDAFALHEMEELKAQAPPSVIASVRFIYYFPEKRRIELLQSFSKVGAPYILTQYILKDSFRSRRKRFRSWLTRSRKQIKRPEHLKKRRVTRKQMDQELHRAGIKIIQVAPAGPLSDRFYVLGKFHR